MQKTPEDRSFFDSLVTIERGHSIDDAVSFDFKHRSLEILCFQFFRSAARDYAAFVNEHDPIAIFSFVEIVRRHKYRCAACSKLADQIPEAAAHYGIDSTRWLVEKYDFR